MSDSRWAAILFASAFLARVIAWMGSAIFGTDSCHYLLMADWMREGRFHDALSIGYHPMYPLLISAARVVTVSTEQAGSLVSILLGSAATIPLFTAVKEIFGRPAAVLTVLIYAFHPRIVEVQSDVMTEGTFMFFLFSSMWLTWRMTEKPSLERGALLGGAAAAAFLTRPEGILAIVLSIAWPAVGLVQNRRDLLKHAGGIALTVVVLLLLVSPYLLWLKSIRGHWAMSVRLTAENAVGLNKESDEGIGNTNRPKLYRTYFAAIFRLTHYGALIPFFLLGFSGLAGIPLRKLLLYFSFPAGQLAGVFYSLRTKTTMDERYVMAGMTLLSALAAFGLLAVIRAAARRWPESRVRPALCGLGIFLVAVLPVARTFKVRRAELLGYPGAAQWILAHGPRPRAISGLEQVAYYCGSRSYYIPVERDAFLALLSREPLDYIVYSEKDVQNQPQYVAMLRTCERLETPVEYLGPPGTWKVYIHRVR